MNIFAVQLNELLNESKNCAIHKKNEWKVPFLDRTGPFCLFFTVFHCFLKLWFVFQFEWIILLNEYFWFNFEWIILLNEYSRFNFELNIELNHFLARFNVKMNNQNLSATPSQQSPFLEKKHLHSLPLSFHEVAAFSSVSGNWSQIKVQGNLAVHQQRGKTAAN